MQTPREALPDVAAVQRWLAEHVYDPDPDDSAVGKVGLEAEFFPFWTTRDGRPAARLALVEIMGLLDEVAVRRPGGGARPSWDLGGAMLTEEPGAQIEVAGPPDTWLDGALDRLGGVIARLTRHLGDAGVALAAAGLDCWSDRDLLPVQLQLDRYDAMTTYFDRRGADAGRGLMCASCSIQVNLDLGPPAVARRRWLLANLAAPVFVASFAASPSPDRVNARAGQWLALDPTRTGFAPPLVAGSDDPLEHILADVLRADVLLIERDGTAQAGTPGWSFGRWIADGHPRHGQPRVEDLEIHLSTLFPEVRLRGFLEVRGIDALPDRWREAAVTLVVGLLYDPVATTTAIGLLSGHRSELPELLERAARDGLADPVVGPLARRVLDAALEGARRLGSHRVDLAGDYLDRFVHRGRHPSDELREALAEGPEAAFRWARVTGTG